LEISDPRHIDFVGHAFVMADNFKVNFPYVYAVGDGLTIVNIMDRWDPQIVGSIGTLEDENRNIFAYDVVISGDYAYLANNRGILVVDISEPTEPELLGEFESNDDAYGVAIQDQRLFVADGKSGLIILDISNPEELLQIGHCDTPGSARDVSVLGDYAYIADSHSGLRVINIADIENPVEVGFYNSPGMAWDIDIIREGFIILGAYTNVGIYDCSEAMNVSTEPILHPVSIALNSYPNPFNSTTTIKYTLPNATEVSLSLYNLSGQRIETLVNGRMEAGVHRVMLDAGDLSSGLYFVKLEASGQSFARKIMLVK